MNIDAIRNYCLAKPGTTETLPFGPDVVVFKVLGKVFLLLPLDTAGVQFNVKCHPEKAEELREAYDCVLPGYHMNKKHWNTVLVNGTAGTKLLKEWIDHSYELIVQSLPAKQRAALRQSGD